MGAFKAVAVCGQRQSVDMNGICERRTYTFEEFSALVTADTVPVKLPVQRACCNLLLLRFFEILTGGGGRPHL